MARVRKHDGRVVQYDEGKIAHEILKACEAAGEGDPAVAAEFAQMVSFLLRKYHPDAEEQGAVLDATIIDEMIEKVLLQAAPEVAKTFMLRAKRRSEHDEQQAARPPAASSYGQKRLFPDDTLTVEAESSAEAHHWERERIVEQLRREADLMPALAEQVAQSVEQRLYASGLKRISTGVIRELVSAELFANGYTRERERQAMLGVPKHDVQSALLRGRPGDEADVSFRDATEIDRYLHEEVLRRYTLQEVHSPEVRAAHTDGRLHLHNLGSPIRLESVRVCPEGIKHGWPRRPPRDAALTRRQHRAGERVAAPATEEQFFALLRRYAEELQQMATGPVVFTNLSLVLAPLVAEHSQEKRRALLRRLFGALSGPLARRLTLEFPLALPQEHKRAKAVGLAGAEQQGRTLGDLEAVVRELARDVVALLLEGSHQALLAPDVAIAVDASALTQPEANEVLEAAVDCAARHGAPRFSLPRQRPEVHLLKRSSGGAPGAGLFGAGKELGAGSGTTDDASLIHDADVAVFSVALNLPQTAYRAGRGNHDGFAAECETLLSLARKAVHERYQFMLGSLARLSSALLHARGESDAGDAQPYHPATLPLKHAHVRLELVGLAEAMAYLSGDVEPAADDKRAALQEIEPSAGGEAATRGGLRAVSYLAFTLKEQAAHSPLELRLAEAREPEVAERFRRIDARTFPSYVESLAARGFLLPGEPYTLGVKLPGETDPLSVLTRQGRFHTMLAPDSEVVVPPRMPTHEATTLAEAIKQAIWHTGAHGLAFPVYALSCPACGECRSTPLARPALCPSCGHNTPDYGVLQGNEFQEGVGSG